MAIVSLISFSSFTPNVTGQGTRHYGEGTLHPIVGFL